MAQEQEHMASIFSEFNSWLGFPPGAQVIFILGTSLLAGPEALQTGPFQKHMSWNSSRVVRSDQSKLPRSDRTSPIVPEQSSRKWA